MKVTAWVCLLSSLMVLSLAGAQGLAPTLADDVPMPYGIDAPWPAGITWDAGGLGYYYEQGTHKRADLYALDFNAADQSDGGVLVLSVADGVVRQASCSGTGGYGCEVVIGHAGDGTYCYESRYAHLRDGSVLVSKNDWVAQGEPVGRVGSTGTSTKDHLHFAVYRRPLEECYPWAAARNDAEMAVKPEPMEGVRPIEEGDDITSSNYAVGLARLTEQQMRVPGTPLPERHEAMVETYRRYGGQFWVFGRVEGPVRRLEEGEVYYQEFGPFTLVDDVAWYGQGSAIVEQGGEAHLLLGPIWRAYRDAADAATRYGGPISDSYEWYRRDAEGEVAIGFRNDFREASVISATNFLALQPNELSELVFEIQNTGNVPWLPGEGYALVNTNEESLGAAPVQALANEIPPGGIAQWVVPVTAPGQIGVRWTEWQMAYAEDPFGAKASCLVAVLPEGELDVDIGALVAQWLDELRKEVEARVAEFFEGLVDRFEEWLQRESERVLRELLESLSQQCCGGAMIVPGAVAVAVWTSRRGRRKRMGNCEHD